jgi:NAD+ synthase
MSQAKDLTFGLQEFFKKRGFAKAVVGLSGGVDSALVIALAVKALGKENVAGLILPEKNVSSEKSTELALKLAAQLGVQTFEFDITAPLRGMIGLPWRFTPLANQNIRTRLRMLLLYHYALSKQALVLGTSNKSELLLGYGTKFGDFAADVEVIATLWKTEVWKLAKKMKLPQEIIEREPTAELAPNQTDAGELGADYKTLDKILQKLEANKFKLPKGAGELTKKVWERVKMNRHKTELIPIISS